MQLARSMVLVGALLCGGLVVIVVTAVASAVTGTPVDVFTRDPAATTGMPFYTGSMSILTTGVWAAVAALAGVAAWLVPSRRRLMTGFSVLSGVLLVDDALMLHESVAPELGIPEVLFLAFYGVYGFVLLWRFARPKLAAGTGPLVLGAVLLAMSAAIDVINRAIIVEDGLKLLGALVWLAVPVLTLAERRVGPSRP